MGFGVKRLWVMLWWGWGWAVGGGFVTLVFVTRWSICAWVGWGVVDALLCFGFSGFD